MRTTILLILASLAMRGPALATHDVAPANTPLTCLRQAVVFERAQITKGRVTLTVRNELDVPVLSLLIRYVVRDRGDAIPTVVAGGTLELEIGDGDSATGHLDVPVKNGQTISLAVWDVLTAYGTRITGIGAVGSWSGFGGLSRCE